MIDRNEIIKKNLLIYGISSDAWLKALENKKPPFLKKK